MIFCASLGSIWIIGMEDIKVQQDFPADWDKQVYEDRIKWLKRDLYRSELEIDRLYKE